MGPDIDIDRGKVAEFCRRWKVAELALFGSVLRDDFGPDSDVDVLVSFAEDARPGLSDLCRMEDELKALFRRDVDLITRKSVEQSRNYIRREEILGHVETIHAAR